jgi:hypothetical protein
MRRFTFRRALVFELQLNFIEIESARHKDKGKDLLSLYVKSLY